MWEFEIENNVNKETTWIFGYNVNDAFRRSGYIVKEWTVIYSNYAG